MTAGCTHFDAAFCQLDAHVAAILSDVAWLIEENQFQNKCSMAGFSVQYVAAIVMLRSERVVASRREAAGTR